MQQVYYVTARPDQFGSDITMYQRISINQLNEILKKNPSAKITKIKPVIKGANKLSSDSFVVVKFNKDAEI